jgi:hypothetical protein
MIPLLFHWLTISRYNSMENNVIDIWQNIATTSVGIIVTMMGFWFAIGRKMATVSEVCELIETRCPYLKDKQFLIERLNSNKEIQSAFAEALQKNTEVLSELRIQIATLGKTLEALEDRIEKR